MDAERKILQKQSEKLKTQLSDALHQVKNPIQALRTYGKLLQRKLADSDFQGPKGGSPQLLELTRHLVAQSDRVVDLMLPVRHSL
jgi:nitrogen-specific signal transduction histidine kinase